MKQTKILLLIMFSLFGLVSSSCFPSGEQPAKGWAGAVVYNDIIYVGSMEGKVIAVNASAGNLEWTYTIEAPSGDSLSCGQTSTSAAIYGTPATDGELVYAASYDGKLYALNAATGAVRWDYPKEGDMGSIVARPLIADTTVYVCSSEDKEGGKEKRSRVYALDTTYGEFKWQSDSFADKLWTTPFVAEGVVYVSTFDGQIHTLSTETGNSLPWKFQAEVGFVSSPMLYEDTIFVGSFDHNLYAIKIGSDTALWKFPGDNWFWATPVVEQGVVYAGCLDGRVYAIAVDSGEQLWEFDLGSPIVASPVLLGNHLIAASEQGDVYIINPETGQAEKIKNRENDARPTINSQIRASLCTHEDVVYIHAQDDKLYPVDIEQKKVREPFSLDY